MNNKKRIVVFTGAGVSEESGIKTFRGNGGLWEEYNIEDVATPQAWAKNPELVLEFYNKRRKQVVNAQPNKAHYGIAALEEQYDVHVITQNIDDLHERAGSKKILHLHGEIRKSRSTVDARMVYEIQGTDLLKGEKCEKGSQLRPHIVWFGEEVPNMDLACTIVQLADILIIVGTSLNVYPAAGLIHYASPECIKYLIDPNAVYFTGVDNLDVITEKAGIAVPELVAKLLS
jgi:NAD-dependent deacetylase